MAIAFARVHFISRAKGQSAVAAIAYRSGSKLNNIRLGTVEDYSRHADHVVHSEIMLPSGASKAYLNREFFWNAVEKAEDKFNNHHKKAQVAADCILALPRDPVLTKEDLIELSKKYAKEHFVSKGIPVDLNIHDKGDGNPHVHILRATRRLSEVGFDRLKARDINPEVRRGRVQVDELEWQKWRDCQNEFFIEKGYDLQVDPNGIIAQVHLGKNTFHHPHREKTTHWKQNQKIIQEQKKALLKSPSILLSQITATRAIFTRADLAKLLDQQMSKVGVNDPLKFQEVLARVEASKNLVHLGPGIDGKNYYTTLEMLEAEVSVQEHADKLLRRRRHSVSERLVEKHIASSTLSEEQADAVRYLTRGEAICALLGRAGTGKSFTFSVAKSAWEKAGFNVTGIALSGKAADNLEQSSGIPSRTIDSFLHGLKSGRIKLGATDIVVMDEAGMADSLQLKNILENIRKSGAKFVYAGDPDQTLPVGPGAPLRALLERTGYVELCQIRRQKTKWMREATLAFAESRIEKALEYYQNRAFMTISSSSPSNADIEQGNIIFYSTGGDYYAAFKINKEIHRQKIVDQRSISKLALFDLDGEKSLPIDYSRRLAKSCNYHQHLELERAGSFINFGENIDNSMTLLIDDWEEAYKKHGGSECAIMAHTNTEVVELNLRARQRLVDSKQIESGFTADLSSGKKMLAVGDRIQFLKNMKKIGVSNGQFATISKLRLSGIRNKRVVGFEVLLDGSSTPLKVDLADYASFDYGYAATVNKFQGQTVNASFTHISGFGWNRYLAYTAMSRHRDSAKMYVNRETYADLRAFKKGMSREAQKDGLADWPWYFRNRRGMMVNGSVIARLQAHLTNSLKLRLSHFRDQVEEFIAPGKYWARKSSEVKAKSHIDQAKQRNKHAVDVYNYVEACKIAGEAWSKFFEEKGKVDGKVPTHNPLYQEALSLSSERDEIAYKINSCVENYLDSCNYYKLDLNTIEEHANGYISKKNIESFLERPDGELAYEICKNSKSHLQAISLYQEKLHDYFCRSGHKFDDKQDANKTIWKCLRGESVAYERNKLLSDLKEDESQKIGFLSVESYIEKYQHAADLWRQFFDEDELESIDDDGGDIDNSNSIKVKLLASAKEASRLRNQEAKKIFDNLDQHRLGLNFYNVDMGGPKKEHKDLYLEFSDKSNLKHDYFSLRRGIKLKKYALQEYAKERVEEYLSATDQEKKSILADKILQYPKQHNRWIGDASAVGLGQVDGLNKDDIDKKHKENYFKITKSLKQDAIFIRRQKLINRLSKDKRDSLYIVEEYLKYEKMIKLKWNDFYSNGKKECDAITANQLAEKRDALAIQLLEDIKAYIHGINLYDISIKNLQKSLKAQQCRDRIKSFIGSKGIKKENIASFIVENRGAHTSAVSLLGVDWRTIYAYADSKKHMDLKLSIDKKDLKEYNSASSYTRLNRRIAKILASKKKNNTRWSQEQQYKFDRLQSKRDSLAAYLISRPRKNIEVWSCFRINHEKCKKYASKHAIMVSQLIAYKQERLKIRREIVHLLRDNNNPEKEKIDLSKVQSLSEFAKKTLANKHKMSMALNAANLSLNDLNEDNELSKKIEKILTLKNVNQIKTNVNQSINIPKPVVISKKTKKTWDIELIKNRLNERAKEVALAAVNQSEVYNSKKSTSNKIIFGEKGGSLQVTISGDKTGFWNDFSSTIGGGRDLLSFIQKQQSLSFKESIDWAVNFLGLGEHEMIVDFSTNTLNIEKQRDIADESFNPQQWKRIIEARKIWEESKPIHGTLAESYLREHRKISGQISSTYRFNPSVINYADRKKYPALVVSATNSKGEVQAVQTIYIDPKTNNKIDKSLRQKQNLGPTKGACVWLNGFKEGQPVALVEGPETAATVLEAKGASWSVVCTLGSSNLKSLSLPKGCKDIIIIQDNDIANEKTHKSALDAAKYYSDLGVSTWRTKPLVSGYDFNDVHQKNGIEEVKQQLEKQNLCQPAFNPEKEIKIIENQLKIDKEEKINYMSEARVLNRTGQTQMALDVLNRNKMIFSADDGHQLQKLIVKDYLAWKGASLDRSIIASSKVDVNVINDNLHSIIKNRFNSSNGQQKIINIEGGFSKEFGVGDIINLKEDLILNKRKIKSQIAKIVLIKNDHITIKLSDKTQATFNCLDFKNFDYGFCLTYKEIYKAKQSFVCINNNTFSQKEISDILEDGPDKTYFYVNKEIYKDFDAFQSHLNSSNKHQIDWDALKTIDHRLIQSLCDLNEKATKEGLSDKHRKLYQREIDKQISRIAKLKPLMHIIEKQSYQSYSAFKNILEKRVERSHER